MSVYNKITIQFVDCPLDIAIRQLCQEGNINCSWASSLSGTKVSGRYVESSADEILQSIATVNDFSFYRSGSVCLLSAKTETEEPIFNAFVRSTVPAESLKIEGDIQISQFGSIRLITGKREDVLNVLAALQSIQSCINRGYVAELQLVKMSRDSYLKLEADFKSSGINLFSGVTSLNDLFTAYLSWDGSTSRVKTIQKPVLYLTDGQEAVFTTGSTRTMEEKTASETGYVSTSGYQEFSDGFSLKLTASYLKPGVVTLGVDLEQSRFRETSQSSGDLEHVPVNDKTTIKNPSILCSFDKYYLIGAMLINEEQAGGKLFGISGKTEDSILTVWVKIKEIDVNNSNVR